MPSCGGNPVSRTVSGCPPVRAVPGVTATAGTAARAGGVAVRGLPAGVAAALPHPAVSSAKLTASTQRVQIIVPASISACPYPYDGHGGQMVTDQKRKVSVLAAHGGRRAEGSVT